MECNPMNAHKHQLHKDLVCIEYPGLVRNPDRMMASLGGALELSAAIGTEKRRLELRFRPESIYAKPAFGDRNPTTGLVLKLKVRRKRSQPNEVEVRSMQIAGRVSLQYKFECMCDFQQLPAFRNQAGVVECLYDKLVPAGVITSTQAHEKEPVPYFTPPISFSRFDSTQLSIFKSKEPKEPASTTDWRVRAPRTKHGVYQSFSLSAPLPKEPNPIAERVMYSKNLPLERLDLVRKHFQERPIWTKAALKSALQLSEDDIRYILPAMGLYYTNGPWRGTWVRFGYDPRQSAKSRYYQLLDFRIRTIGAMHDKVKVKRSTNPVKPCMRFANPGVNNRDPEKPSINRKISPQNNYIFTEDTLPQMRIMFYQYCDVHVPQIQQMLEKVPTPPACDEKSGWLPLQFDVQCRDILTAIVLNNFKKRRDTDPSASEFEETEGDETELTFDEDDSGDEVNRKVFADST